MDLVECSLSASQSIGVHSNITPKANEADLRLPGKALLVIKVVCHCLPLRRVTPVVVFCLHLQLAAN